jgi:MFS family permease
MISSTRQARLYTYLAGFALAASNAIAAYTNSSFLEQFVSEKNVGVVYAVSALASIALSFNSSRLISRFGNKQMMLGLASINVAALTGVVIGWPQLAIVCVGIYLTTSFLLATHLDLQLESLSHNQTTGHTRGLFLTTTSIAWLLSPLLAGHLANTYGYAGVYTMAGAATVLFAYLVYRHLPPSTHYHNGHYRVGEAWLQLYRGNTPNNRNLRRILWLDFLLNIFYAVMVVYMPIYLLNHVGFNWSQIGIIFTVMLLPFVLLDFILGVVADSVTGEKEIMVAGLLVMIVATLIVGFTTSRGLAWWALLLFTTRIGAASVETMKETYLFKKIAHTDANLVFLARDTYPTAYIVATLAASWWLITFTTLHTLFILVGLVLILGLPAALKLQDTR